MLGPMKVESLQAIFAALNEVGTRYLIVGGLAVAAHGYVRYTVDVDLVVALDADNTRRALSALQRLGYCPRAPVAILDFADEKTREEWIRDKGMVVFQLVSDEHIETNVDVFVQMPFDFEAQWSKAAWLSVVDGVKAPVLAMDELLTMKRQAGRGKDLLDIEALTAMHKLK